MDLEIKEHHRKAIDNLTAEYENDPRFPTLIIGGSVAKNVARDDSDVDFMIVANDEEYAKREADGDLFINRTDLCDYPGGYVDGKIISMHYLREVAKIGNEPSRAAFDGAFVAYSKLPNFEELLQKIPVYPEKGHEKRLKAFYSMAFIQNWLMGEASRHGNVYTITRAASQLSLFAGRVILAHNKVLFPYHKWFLTYLERCKDKPEDFIANINSLLKEPSLKNAETLFKSLQEFKDWGVPDIKAYLWFMEEVEWSWMQGKTPLEDL